MKQLDTDCAVIVGGGELPKGEYVRSLIDRAGTVICCDGAVAPFLKRFPERLPDLVIGDLDSLPPGLAKQCPCPVVRVPDQETNDQTKAFRWLMENRRGLSSIYFVAATGKRSDHTIANLALIMDYAWELYLSCGKNADAMPHMEIPSDHEIIFPLVEGGSFGIGKDRAVSIFSCDSTLKIKSDGLIWPTDSVIFDSLWKASLNKSGKDIVTLHFNHPSKVLVVLN